MEIFDLHKAIIGLDKIALGLRLSDRFRQVFLYCHFLAIFTCFGYASMSYMIYRESEREREIESSLAFCIDKSIKLIYIHVQRAPGLGILNASQ